LPSRGFLGGQLLRLERRLHASRSTAESKSKKQVQQRASHGQPLRGGFVQVPFTVDSMIEVRFVDGTTVSVSAEKLAVTLKTLQALQREGVANA